MKKKKPELIKQHHDVSQAHVAVKVHHSQQSVALACESKTGARLFLYLRPTDLHIFTTDLTKDGL